MRPYADGGRKRFRDNPAPARIVDRPEPLIPVEKLVALEWSGEKFNGYEWIPACRVCRGLKPGNAMSAPSEEGHRDDCWLGLALAPAPDATLAAQEQVTRAAHNFDPGDTCGCEHCTDCRFNDATSTCACERCTDGSCGDCYRGRVSGWKLVPHNRGGWGYDEIPTPCDETQRAAVDAYLGVERSAAA